MTASVPRFLVCAGSTQQPMDQVRAWGNIFTGGTGLALARALAAYGPVDLLTANAQHRERIEADSGTAFPLCAHGFVSHHDLCTALDQLMGAHHYAAVCMSAAVSDYTPCGAFCVESRVPGPEGQEYWTLRSVQAGKVSSQHPQLAILGSPTEKIVDRFRGRYAFTGLLVKFKLEVDLGVDRLLDIGEASRLASGADFLVANTLAMVTGEHAGAWLLGDGPARFLPRHTLASGLAVLLASRLQVQAGPRLGLGSQLMALWERIRQDPSKSALNNALFALQQALESGCIDYQCVAPTGALDLRALDTRDPSESVLVRLPPRPQHMLHSVRSTWGRECAALIHQEHFPALGTGQ